MNNMIKALYFIFKPDGYDSIFMNPFREGHRNFTNDKLHAKRLLTEIPITLFKPSFFNIFLSTLFLAMMHFEKG